MLGSLTHPSRASRAAGPRDVTRHRTVEVGTTLQVEVGTTLQVEVGTTLQVEVGTTLHGHR